MKKKGMIVLWKWLLVMDLEIFNKMDDLVSYVN